MTWFGPAATVEVVEDETKLVVRVREVPRKINYLIAGVAIGLFLFFGFWHGVEWGAVVFAGLILLQMLWKWAHGPAMHELLIDDSGLRSAKEGRIAWLELHYLRFEHGGEDEESGIYAKRQWSRVLVLPGVNRAQGDEIVKRIFTRFPMAPMADDDGPPSIFGKGSELVRLDLSKRDES